MVDRTILTINTGSSSLKAGLYGPAPAHRVILAMRGERLGTPEAQLRVVGGDDAELFACHLTSSDHVAAVETSLGWLRDSGNDAGLAVIGHRIVHGGPNFAASCLITEAVRAILRDLVPLDPDHLPQALAAIDAAGRAYPDLPQVACFDTAFHRAMPSVARRYPLPARFAEAGVVRYGFHGLSYEYIVGALRDLDPALARGRLIIAHLGNGASMAAVRDGVGIDTTMGLTPTGGLVMGTRSGDLDPGVPLHLLRAFGLDPAALADLLHRRSGLLGVSGTSADMRDLLARETTDPRAAEAIALFCYAAKKHIGALAAVLGGLDGIVFTGGIGERSAAIRARICDGLDFLGIALDPGRNAAGESVISRADAAVALRVLPTDEDVVIARHSAGFLDEGEMVHDGNAR